MPTPLPLDSRWESLREGLLVLQRLQQGPADKATLIRAVQAALPDAFRQDNAKARSRHFERVLATLRHRLEVTITWDRSQRHYVLEDLGPFFEQPLIPDALQGLAFLLESFNAADDRFQQLVHPLLEHLRNRLPTPQRRELERSYPVFRFEGFQQRTTGTIDPAVWQTAQTAVTQHRLLRFFYLTPKHDGRPVQHTVEPFDIFFRDGHTYLNAFCRQWIDADGQNGVGRWTPYRIDYIQPHQLTLLPTTFPVNQRSRRLITVRYKIHPDIGRGNMAQHFEELVLGDVDAGGWIKVTGKATTVFEAYRTLLRLGRLSIALDPPELVDMMRDAARGLADHYLK